MNNLFEQLTNNMTESIESAVSLALHNKNQEVELVHFLWALLTNSHSVLNQIFNKMNELSKNSGHGGSDLKIDWRLIDCLHNGLPLDQDVYDAAAWSSILPLTDWSVRNNSNSIKVPDFTAGAWKTNKPNMDIELKRGGNTKVKS